ncbi:MAG: DMT family transporter [Rhodospirillales bacterium]|nr:DMT family transporter [Rhodospirillales bacterium]
MLSPRLAGYLFAIAAPVCWSVGGVIIRSVEAAPWDIVFWRSFGHVATFSIFLFFRYGGRAISDFVRAGWAAPASALLICGTFVFHILAMTSTTVANVLVLQAMAPLLVAVFAWLILGERIEPLARIAIAIAFAGMAPVVGSSLGGGELSGDVFALMVAVCSAANIIVVRRARDHNLLPATALAAMLAVAIAWMESAPFVVSLRDIGLLAVLGVIQMSLGLTCFYLALRRLPAAEVALITLLEPVLGPIWVWLLIGEEPAALTIIGGVAILGALIFNALLGLRRPAAL